MIKGFKSKNGKTFDARLKLVQAYKCTSCGSKQTNIDKCYKCGQPVEKIKGKLAKMDFTR
jgi:DNA-directed RNA polymerase subunit RPC12/RpoP